VSIGDNSITVTVSSLGRLGLDYFITALLAALLDHFLLAIGFHDWLLGNYLNFFLRLLLFGRGLLDFLLEFLLLLGNWGDVLGLCDDFAALFHGYLGDYYNNYV
jgi:hypothetical protein